MPQKPQPKIAIGRYRGTYHGVIHGVPHERRRHAPSGKMQGKFTLDFFHHESGEMVHYRNVTSGKTASGRLSPVRITDAHRDKPVFRHGVVKTFAAPISDIDAFEYDEVIRNLRKAHVILPPMGMLKHEKLADGWVQVTKGFGNDALPEHLHEIDLHHLTTPAPQAGLEGKLLERERNSAVVQLTRIAGAGYTPATSIFKLLYNEEKKLGPKLVPVDIDPLVLEGKIKPVEAAHQLIHNIVTTLGARYLSLALRSATPAFRKTLQQEIKNLAPDIKNWNNTHRLLS